MSKHIVTVQIPEEEFERVNRLLRIKSLKDMSDNELLEQGANTFQNEGIFNVVFDDGSSMNFDLRSDASDYYDDVVWTSADGSVDINLDYEYELDDIEVNIDGEEYIVRIARV